MRLAVLASGTGSNFDAIADYFEGKTQSAAVQLVAAISNRPHAPVLDKARNRGIAAVALQSHNNAEEILGVLREHRVEMLALAGYLKLVPGAVVHEFRNKTLNVHPALLPAFGGDGMYGIRVNQAVVDAGARITGATIHLVTGEYDRGAVLAQWQVPVVSGESALQLAHRVLQIEHLLYARVIAAYAAGRINARNPVLIKASEDGVAILDRLLKH
jgi:formyltetrahydrofolate-dependent phosphoribosylglycinamide formyltransferase